MPRSLANALLVGLLVAAFQLVVTYLRIDAGLAARLHASISLVRILLIVVVAGGAGWFVAVARPVR